MLYTALPYSPLPYYIPTRQAFMACSVGRYPVRNLIIAVTIETDQAEANTVFIIDLAQVCPAPKILF